MAAILNGFLPARRKDQFAQERILNTRWGDAGISAPMHGGWSTQPTTDNQPESSPELDRELPPTPPHIQDEQDGVFIVNDDESVGDNQDYDDDVTGPDRDNFTITIPLPWKKKNKTASHNRKPSGNSVLNARFAPPRRVDLVSPPPLATAEAAAIPLPESRISSPIGRTATTSPVLSFRSRLASPNLGDILSPVAEGFAKSGPSTRQTAVLSPLQYGQVLPLERPPSASSIRSGLPRRPSIKSEGIGASTMSSQASGDEQAPDMYRPPSRGIGSTAHMRASSRGPRANSRGPRPPSVEPFDRQPASVELTNVLERSILREPSPIVQHVIDFEPIRRRAPSVEPVRRRAPSVEPVRRRAPSVEPVSTRAPSAGPPRQTASSPEPTSIRAPSVGPIEKRRAMSREPRGRRGQSMEPRPRVRFHSEASHRFRRRDSSSSNDGSVDSSDDKEDSSEIEPMTIVDRFERDYNTSRRPRRRRSIASPISSPTAAVFGSASAKQSHQETSYESISTRVGLASVVQPGAQRNPPRNRSQSRTRGLYADMHDDFRLLARDVHLDSTPPAVTNSPAISTVPSLSTAQPQQHIVNPILQRTASPALSSHLPGVFASGVGIPSAIRVESERPGYSSDSSLTGLPTISTFENQASGKAMLAVMARDRKDQRRHEERERAREKVARRLERERERIMAMNALSDCESVASGQMSSSEKTHRVYGGGMVSDSEYDTSQRLSGGKKTLVPNAEEIWG